MYRRLLAALALSAGARASAQAVSPAAAHELAGPLIASTDVDGIAQASSAIAPTRQFWVINKSAYPIVVYSFNLATCVNVKQACGRAPIDVHVRAGQRALIGRVDAQDRARRYTYDWTYDWMPDTSDARVAAALRARGVGEASLGTARNLATQAEPAATDATTPASTGGPITPEERQRKVTLLDANNRRVATGERFRFRVARGSILGSTQVQGAPVMATGACIDPAEVARYEGDTTITGSPAVPPKLAATSISLPTLPPELSASTPADVRVIVRWVVDSTGATLPGSVTVRESPHGLLSVKMCGAVIGAHLAPGRDAAGQPVRTWVEAPLRVAP